MEEEGLQEWEDVFSRLECLHEESREHIRIDKLVSAVMDLNQSTMSYWWRGGIPMKRFREYTQTKHHQSFINSLIFSL